MTDGPHPRQMCSVCHQILNALENTSTHAIRYVHGTWADHEPRPVNEVPADTILVCDFCLRPHPTWTMPCAPMQPVGSSDTVMVSVGDWAACNTCKDLVLADKYTELVERIATGRQGVDPEMAEMEKNSPAFAAMIRLSLMQQMQDFRKSRTGAPIPLAQAQWVAAKLSNISGEPG